MTNFFDFNNKLQRALDNYSKTTETMFKYQQKVMDRQYNTLLEVIKTVNSIDYGVDTTAISKPATKATAKPVATKPVAKPVAKAPVKKEPAKPVAPKPVAKAPVKKEPTKPVAPKPVAKAPVKKEPTKPVAPKPVAKAPVKKEAVKPVAKAPAKKAAAPKNASQDRLAALKAATQQAVKTNQNVKK